MSTSERGLVETPNADDRKAVSPVVDNPLGYVSRREVEWDTLLVTRREFAGRRVLDFKWFGGSCTYNGPALLRQFIERLQEELAWMEDA
jgi:hypothetical protein